jgi:hypothetical protein
VAQLNRHLVWDALLVLIPAASALIYIFALLFQAAWVSRGVAILTVLLALALATVTALLFSRSRIPTVRGAARLVDEKSGAKDHFLTLATMDTAAEASPLLGRLRMQAAGYLNRIELRRDFPYKLKRSCYWSFGLSLIAVILIHLLLPIAQSAHHAANVPERLRELAQQMAAKPELRGLAEELVALASKLDDPKISGQEKQALTEQMEDKIDERHEKEQEKDNRELLAQAAGALESSKSQQDVASGGDQRAEQQKGGGGIESDVPQKGQGENTQSQGGSGDSKGDPSSRSQEQMEQGKSAQANPKELGAEKNQAGDAKNDQNQPDANQPGKDAKERAGKPERASKDGSGKQTPEEPPPQGGPQADRFHKPGEGKEGLAAKGYVTVQMPEELVADAKGESRTTRESKNARGRSQVPVSNVPLPAHVPNAPLEKQQMPVEYRGIIR